MGITREKEKRSTEDEDLEGALADSDREGEDEIERPMKIDAGEAMVSANSASVALATEKAGDEEEEEVAPAQLGSQRYVMAGFFALALLSAYILGKIVHGVWSTLASKDWFSRALPTIAAVADEERTTYGTIIGGILAIALVVRTYRRPDVRAWTDDVAGELAKVKWPDKKEVSNSTMIVIAASTIATLYLALLDRFWAFVTNLVYGTGT